LAFGGDLIELDEHASRTLGVNECHFRIVRSRPGLVVDHAGTEKQQRKDAGGGGLQTAGDVIAWCIAHSDAWLRECAARVASRPLAAEE